METALGASMLRLLRRQGQSADDVALTLRDEVTRLARTLTRKQRTSSPGLIRDLAAEIGKEAPEFVIEASNRVGLDVTSEQSLTNLISHGKKDLADRLHEVLDTDEATATLSEDEAEHDASGYTSSAQGEAVGHYLEVTGDSEANNAVSDYYQLEADAPSFGEG